jgi:8-oxo-dGTP pyrophosphatase MutT (NUDIX family)
VRSLDIPAWLDWTREISTESRRLPVLRRMAGTSAYGVGVIRSAAVLVLFGGTGPDDADVLLLQRAASLRSHGGQVAFPGGASDPGDPGPVATALREAREETGLDPNGVTPLTTLSPIFVPPSRFEVTPVLAWWHAPSLVAVVDPAESQRVARVSVAELTDPANRFVLRGPSGFSSPAFAVDGMLVWGFTGGLLSELLAAAGWEHEWDRRDVRDMAGWKDGEQ